MQASRLRELPLKGVYHSKSNSLLDDFYLPALTLAVRYDRAAGYFSSAMLAIAARGLSAFVRNAGKMRLIIGSPLSEEEFAAVKSGASRQDRLAESEQRLTEILEENADRQTKTRLELLCYLVASDRLQIRIAFTQRGMFHDKTGVLQDSSGDKVVFQGSANETAAALLPDFNYESIAVYPSWKGEIFSTYGQPFEDEFERIWNGEVEGVITADVLSSTYELLRKHAPEEPPQEDGPSIMPQPTKRTAMGQPRLPTIYNGAPYALKTHQERALAEWENAGFRGIFNMATGAGKTVTSLHAATETCNKSNRSLVVLIVVPYQNLADQWCEVAEQFGFFPIQAYRSVNLWKAPLSSICSSLMLPGNKTHYCIVSVKNTMSSDEFQRLFVKIPPDRLLVIADECHHYATMTYAKAIPSARYMIGLSATPWRSGDTVRQDRLEATFGKQCFQYTIDDAMQDGVLCKYEYLPIKIHLSEEEYETYSELSREISRLFSMRENGLDVDDTMLTAKLMARARILGSADDKFASLAAQLSTRPRGNKTLYYCGDGSTEESGTTETLRDIERVSEILHRYGWKSSRFTAGESRAERERILANFSDESIDAMVSIRVLDEGIDIPACSEAYLLASSRNERQYVQRRGRILRKSKGKALATIHDFVCLPPEGIVDTTATALVSAELKRFREFSRLAVNHGALNGVAESLVAEYRIDESTTMEIDDEQ